MTVNQVTNRITLTRALILAIFAALSWALCGSIVFIGRQFWSMETTLIIHALGVPVISFAVSWLYFTYFHYTTPLQTAVIFTLTAIFLDVIVVATFIEGSYAMFASFIGTWLPFALMFLTTYVTGTWIGKRLERNLVA